LTGLGGFASAWLLLPNPRQSAYRLDQVMDSQERLLTAVDWILSEKPRTETSERLLAQASALLRDEDQFLKRVKGLEPVAKTKFLWLATVLIPLSLLIALPPHVGLPPSTALWLGESQVDQLTEELLKELEDTDGLDTSREKLDKLLEQLEKQDPNSELSQSHREAQKERLRMADRMRQSAEAKEKARELLETLAQRARQSQPLSEKDKIALRTLREKLSDKAQQQSLDQASEAWQKEDFDQAAEALEALQKSTGESAQELSRSAQEAAGKQPTEGDQGQDFDADQGDQFEADGRPKNGSGTPAEKPANKPGQGRGQAGEGEGRTGSEPGKGTTLEEETNPNPADGRQSLRRGESHGEWLEKYEHLHAPERTEFQKAQTRVRGEASEEGPRFRTDKQGLGSVTEPSARDGFGGVLQYREEAENAILREEVPADYRDNVRVYFESLDD